MRREIGYQARGGRTGIHGVAQELLAARGFGGCRALVGAVTGAAQPATGPLATLELPLAR